MFSLLSAIITFLIIFHIMVNVYTIYVHRMLGHNYFECSKGLVHFFRFWMWFTFGMSWPNWQQHYAAKHRKHHKYSDTEQDPNSPYHFTFKQMFEVAHNDPKKANYIHPDELNVYAPDIVSSDDWIEKKLYCPHRRLGLKIHWVLVTLLFGIPGFIFGSILFFGANYIGIFIGNYATHKIGFNYAGNKGADRSKIIFPLGIFFGGEELHAHHHNDTRTAHFHRHWWELDTGWLWCRLFMFLGLMKLRNSTFS